MLAGSVPVLVHNDNGIDLSGATEWRGGNFPLGGSQDAGGPKNGILYRIHNGQVGNYAMYDENGMIIRGVDLLGAAHSGADGVKVPTPHVVEYDYRETPDGRKYPNQKPYVTDAGPEFRLGGGC